MRAPHSTCAAVLAVLAVLAPAAAATGGPAAPVPPERRSPSAADRLTLYGRLDLNVTRGPGDGPWELSQASNSRLGLRGSERLGAGRTQIVFQLESRIDADVGATEPGRFWGRESWVGLRGSMGSLRLGRTQTPVQRIASQYDPHGTDGIGSLGSSGLLLGHAGAVRMDRAWHAESASLQGWTLAWSQQVARAAGTPAGGPARAARLRWVGNGVDLSLGHARLGPGDEVASAGAALEIASGVAMAQWHGGRRGGIARRVELIGATLPAAGLQWRLALSRSRAFGSPPSERRLLALGADRPLSARTALYATLARRSVSPQPPRWGAELGLRHQF